MPRTVSEPFWSSHTEGFALDGLEFMHDSMHFAPKSELGGFAFSGTEQMVAKVEEGAVRGGTALLKLQGRKGEDKKPSGGSTNPLEPLVIRAALRGSLAQRVRVLPPLLRMMHGLLCHSMLA
jgi:hypothetical protein